MKLIKSILGIIIFAMLTVNLLGQQQSFSAEEQELIDFIKKLRLAEVNNDKAFTESAKIDQYLAIYGTPFNLQTSTAAVIKEDAKEKEKMQKLMNYRNYSLNFENFKVNILDDHAVVLFKQIEEQKTSLSIFELHQQFTYFLVKKDGKWKVVAWQVSPLTYSAYPKSEQVIFDVLPLSEKIKTFDWKKIAEDKEGDGARPKAGDGKSLSYFYEKDSEMLWFRYELYDSINEESPAVSLSIDTDDDQKTGSFWYGSVSTFRYDKLLNFGISKKISDTTFRGYNGITSNKAAVISNWMDEKKNNLVFYKSPAEKAYYLGVKRSDISTQAKKINIIGSVGSSMTWNDDIGVNYVTLEF